MPVELKDKIINFKVKPSDKDRFEVMCDKQGLRQSEWLYKIMMKGIERHERAQK